MKITNKEFAGNVRVTVSEREVRIWVCNEKGQNIFRFKAMGEVYQSNQDVTILGGFKK